MEISAERCEFWGFLCAKKYAFFDTKCLDGGLWRLHVYALLCLFVFSSKWMCLNQECWMPKFYYTKTVVPIWTILFTPQCVPCKWIKTDLLHFNFCSNSHFGMWLNIHKSDYRPFFKLPTWTMYFCCTGVITIFSVGSCHKIYWLLLCQCI